MSLADSGRKRWRPLSSLCATDKNDNVVMGKAPENLRSRAAETRAPTADMAAVIMVDGGWPMVVNGEIQKQKKREPFRSKDTKTLLLDENPKDTKTFWMRTLKIRKPYGSKNWRETSGTSLDWRRHQTTCPAARPHPPLDGTPRTLRIAK